jgi:DNA-binding beta-propeller fold protein YncE
MNNSGKIMVMNFGKYTALKAFEFTHKITGLKSPRNIHFFNNTKAYVSDLYARAITVISPSEYTITGKINLANSNPEFYQHPTEHFVVSGNMVFTNCYSFDNKVLVIDPLTDRLIDSVEVLQQPNSMVLDRNGKVWVLCDGGYEGSSYGDNQPGLVRIDAQSRTVEKIFILPEDNWPSKLCINGTADTLYFINGDVWRMQVADNHLPVEPFISSVTGESTRLFFGLGVDPVSSEVYVSDAIDHTQDGVVYRYNAAGAEVDRFKTGIIPGFFYFYSLSNP